MSTHPNIEMIWSCHGVMDRDLQNDLRALCVRPLLQACDFSTLSVYYIILQMMLVYTAMIVRCSTTITANTIQERGICMHSKTVKLHFNDTFAKMIALWPQVKPPSRSLTVWTPQGMAYLRGAGRPQDPVLAAEWLGEVKFILVEKMTRSVKCVSICFNVFNLDPDLFDPKAPCTEVLKLFRHRLMFCCWLFVCVCVCAPVCWANGWWRFVVYCSRDVLKHRNTI